MKKLSWVIVFAIVIALISCASRGTEDKGITLPAKPTPLEEKSTFLPPESINFNMLNWMIKSNNIEGIETAKIAKGNHSILYNEKQKQIIINVDVDQSSPSRFRWINPPIIKDRDDGGTVKKGLLFKGVQEDNSYCEVEYLFDANNKLDGVLVRIKNNTSILWFVNVDQKLNGSSEEKDSAFVVVGCWSDFMENEANQTQYQFARNKTFEFSYENEYLTGTFYFKKGKIYLKYDNGKEETLSYYFNGSQSEIYKQDKKLLIEDGCE